MLRKRIMSGGIALLVGAAAIAVGTEGQAAGAATTSTPGVTANSITVGSISDISEPIPGLFEGAKIGTEAYFAYINSQGGVDGRKLVLDAKDSAFSAGTVTNEAQSIAANDFAIVGGFSLLDGSEQPAVDAAHLPVVTQVLTPAYYSDPNLYSAVPPSPTARSPAPSSGSSPSTPATSSTWGSSVPTRRPQPSPPSTSSRMRWRASATSGCTSVTPATRRPPSSRTSSR